MPERPLIVIFCNSFPPEVGGAPGRIYNLSIVLRDAGYRVRVVCAMPNYPTGRIFRAYRRRIVCDEIIDGIAVKRVWMIPSNASSVFFRGTSIVSFVLSLRMLAYRAVLRLDPALIIVSSPPLPMAADVARFFSRRKKKVLLNVSDIWPLSASAMGADADMPLYKLLQKTEHALYRRADAFTAQSEEILRHIQITESMRKPSMLYRNLPSYTSISERSLPGPPIRIVYPGLLGHAQGILAICKSVDFSAHGVSLHIYGEGAELPLIREWIDAHPKCCVHLYKPLQADEIKNLLRTFHAVLVPLIAAIEGAVPSKLFTAIQAGLPVLYSGGAEGAELVSRHHLGWTAPPGDFSTISKNISALSALSAEAYKEMSLHIEYVGRTVFSKGEQDIRLLRFIDNLVTSPKKTG